MKQLFPLLFLAFFLAILTGANLYLAKRFNVFFEIENTRILFIVFPVLTFFMLFGMLPLSNAVSFFGSLVYQTAAITMGIMLFLLISVLLVDVVGSIMGLVPKSKGVVSLSLTVLVVAYALWNATNTRIKEVQIGIKGLQTELKAVHLSDIHIGHFWGEKTLAETVELTNQQHPDVVFITGDLFDGRIRLNPKSISALKKLNAPAYFVDGNHDAYTGVKEIKQLVRAAGIEVLENEVTHFNQLQIIGLNHMPADENTPSMHAQTVGSTIKETLNSLHIFPGKPTVLMHHSPDGIKYANQHGVHLYLAGHTHAGQIFPASLVARAMFDYNRGLHQFKNTFMYVSQGVGTFGPPMRLGTNSEVTLLRLVPEK